MGWTDINKLAHSEVVFAVLFIAILVYVALYVRGMLEHNRVENTRREQHLIEVYQQQIKQACDREDEMARKAEERERELMAYLDKSNENQKSIAHTLTRIEESLSKLESKVDSNLQAVWRELGSKQDK